MAQIAYKPEARRKADALAAPQNMREWSRQWPARVLILIFLSEIIIPLLIYFGAPGRIDFALEIVTALAVSGTLIHMTATNRVPAGVLLILAVSLVWGLVALFEGQSASATAWGWWKFFQYPILAIYAYDAIRWSPDFGRWLPRFLVALMAFELVLQGLQYVLGEVPGDSLAGSFGNKGVGPQTMFNFLVIALAFGQWAIKRQWRLLVLAVAFGLFSSMLNVTKVYIPFVGLVGVLAMVMYLVRGGQFRQLFLILLVFGVLAAAAVPIFNQFIATQRGLPTLQEYLQPEKIDRYLFTDGDGDNDGKYNLGRGLSVTYAWQILQRDMTTTLFGMGIGSRSSSTGLGILGVGLQADLYGGASGTGMLIMLQEFGVVGVATFVLFTLWMSFVWFRDMQRNDDDDLKALQFGMILYTLLWLVWLWYQKPWSFGVMMTTYWVTAGYIFNRMREHRRSSLAATTDSRRRQRSTPASVATPLQHTNASRLPASPNGDGTDVGRSASPGQ